MTFKEYLKKNKHHKDFKSLKCNFYELTDLYGIEEYTELEELYLFKNDITDIEPLKHLHNLNYINLSYNKIKDISPLKDLKNVEIIYLDNNKLEDLDLESLLAMNKLSEIGICDNNLNDIYNEYASGLSGMYIDGENLKLLKNKIITERRKRLINLL